MKPTNVKIYKPAKNAMQSGRARTQAWVLEYDDLSRRAPEPLMGWTRSSDTLNQVRIHFDTLDHAVAFAKDKGWHYTISPAHQRRVKPRNYSDNFQYRPPAE